MDHWKGQASDDGKNANYLAIDVPKDRERTRIMDETPILIGENWNSGIFTVYKDTIFVWNLRLIFSFKQIRF